MKIILKILFWPINILFAFIIYFLSLRPLSPSEEQLVINYSEKSLAGFILECLFIQSLFALIFSAIVYIIFKSIIREYLNNRSYVLTLIIYFVYSLFCGIEYFLFVKKLAY
jgi:hypothetical protein